jgi:hypothetical protein
MESWLAELWPGVQTRLWPEMGNQFLSGMTEKLSLCFMITAGSMAWDPAMESLNTRIN